MTPFFVNTHMFILYINNPTKLNLLLEYSNC